MQTVATALKRPGQPAPKPSAVRSRDKVLKQAEINKALSETTFYDRIRSIIDNGGGSVTIQIEHGAAKDVRPSLRIIMQMNDQLPLPLIFV